MYKLTKCKFYQMIAKTLVFALLTTIIPSTNLVAWGATENSTLSNEYFNVKIGEYGEINSLKLAGDEFSTNYVLNGENAPPQGASEEHQWMGELMFQTQKDGDSSWTESMTSASGKTSGARKIKRDGNKITVTYENENSKKGIKDFKLEETYELVDNHFKWSMKVTNPDANKALTFGDFGLPMTFNEYWSGQGNELLYETRTVDHSFVGQDSSYIYATRASGQGRFLLFQPDVSTGAKLEYQDHWRENNGHKGSVWAQDTGGWANGLNVFYIHSNVIKSTGSSYLPNTELCLAPGESKEYSFNFTPVQNEKAMKSELYNNGIIDAVAVPGMAFAKDMPAKLYLHTKYDYNKDNVTSNNITSVEVKCSHDTKLYEGLKNSVSEKQPCTKNEGTSVSYDKTETVDGEQYHVFNLKLTDLGVNYVLIHYLDALGKEKVTTLQFYAMDKAEDALDLHANFVTNSTQVNAPGKIQDKIFDDWMMDSKNVRGQYSGYMGWGDDWGFTHGEYLAEKNVYLPIKEQIQAVDNYLDTTIWNGLMREHHEDYRVNDWLDNEPNNTGQGVSRGYAYPHVYNTYFSMYKVASKYPNMIGYKETKETYLLRTYNILKALYGDGISYNWDTGLMGESTTPEIIAALEKEGFYKEAQDVRDIMSKKYVKFSEQKYPYGSEYSYDNTGEEAVYVLAKLQNNKEMMKKIDWKTRACRGLQPIWYHYANPTTICGENWWNFQYSASLIGYCMDDWLRLQDNGMSDTDRALASRTNYAAKLANLTAINSGQIDADPANIGTVAWTYQAELGNSGGQGNGGGNIHNGWRQMSGEADTGLFGALHILSSDVVTDPVFGLFGYGCEVTEDSGNYIVTPLDGLYTKLNFINEKLYIKLGRDQYSNAVVSKNSDSVKLAMKNVEKTAHDTEIELTGLKAGSYEISVDGNAVGSLKVIDDKTVTTTIPMPAGETANVEIKSGGTSSNTAPVVDAGKDRTVELSKEIRLEGSVVDDGQPNVKLTSNWTVESDPEGANTVINNKDKLISDIKLDKVGDYVFKLTASDGQSDNSDTVKITVVEDPILPETLALYTFDNVSTDKRNRDLLSADNEGKGYTAERISNPVLAAGKTGQGQALSLSGSYCGYVRLPADITKRVNDCTITTDIMLSGSQNNNARIFEFRDTEGRYVYGSVINGNELAMGMTDSNTKVNKEISTGINVGNGYWKNIEITIKDNTAIFYVDGVEAGKIENCNFKLSDLSDTQRNFIGRGDSKADGFFNGLIDNFTIKSIAMTSDQIGAAYGSTEGSTPVSAEVSDMVTKVVEAPILPEQVKVLYSNGIYKMGKVLWDSIDSKSYGKVGSFVVEGKVEGVAEKAKLTVHVVEGDAKNIASIATPSGIVNSVGDLGGVKGLNDGYDPEDSADTSHGVWHNWLGGNQGGDAWVQYDWDEPVVLTEADAYYFKNGGGNFNPSSTFYEYKDVNNVWKKVTNAVGLGVELNKYNKTTFSPVVATGIRMTMKPESLGCGVIEWQVYGYSNQAIVSKKALNAAISNANGIKKSLIESGYEDLTKAVTEAETVVNDSTVSQEAVNEATGKVNKALNNLVPKDNNIAYLANVSTSFVSSWEKLSAVNDGIEAVESNAQNIHYGTWGNNSEYETVTYKWPSNKEITSTEIYFWTDGGGILPPSACKYEYEDHKGNWVEVPNPKGLGVELDKYDVTTFDKITTKAFRVTMTKAVADGNGVGLFEWKVIGDKALEIVDKSKLQELYDAHKDDTQGDYKNEDWSKFTKAIDNAKKIIDDSDVTQIEVDSAENDLQSALDQLKGDTDTEIINIARIPTTTPSAVINSVEDLGGVAGLNDGYEPTSSSDTSHGVWHNWLGKQSASAWVQYDWDKPYVITSTDAYYFKDGSGNFAPASVKYEYKDENGEWKDFDNVEGLGVKLDKYNKTTFSPVRATGIRMTMEPLTLGCGLIEWKVYGYPKEKENVDNSKLQKLYDSHKDDTQENYTEKSWGIFIEALNNVKKVLDDEDATIEEINESQNDLEDALNELVKGEDEPTQTTGAAVKVDMSQLKALYDEHKDDTQGDFTGESWDNFIKALKNALTVLENANAKQADVEDAQAGLKLAIDERKRMSNSKHKKHHSKTTTTSLNPEDLTLNNNYDANSNTILQKFMADTIKSMNANIKSTETITTQNGGSAISTVVAINGASANIITTNISDTIAIKADENTKVYVYVERLNAYIQVDSQMVGDNIVFKAQTQILYVVSNSNTLGTILQKGWNNVNGTWYFVRADGNLVTGWYNDNGTWYNLSNEGKMNTKWFKDTDGTWYYLNDSGEMIKGWFKDIDGKWYYLKSNGAMAKNEYVGEYYLDTNGMWLQ